MRATLASLATLGCLACLATLSGCADETTVVNFYLVGLDAGADAAEPETGAGANPACPPRECWAVDPTTCAGVPLGRGACNDGRGKCEAGACVALECAQDPAGECDVEGLSGWPTWRCDDGVAPGAYCVQTVGATGWCCPPQS